MVTVWCNPY